MFSQVRVEFKRITTDLFETFFDGLDGVVPRLLEVYNAATRTRNEQSLKDILDPFEKDVTGLLCNKLDSTCNVCLYFNLTAHLLVLQDTNERRKTAALLGLPHYL